MSIGYLKGRVIAEDDGKIIILTEYGVGYEVRYHRLIENADTFEAFIYHHIIENDQTLWGFKTLAEKKLFELLITVNKVGPSKAHPLITQLGIEDIINAISFDQQKTLCSVKGIGKKMAEQIVISLRDKIDHFHLKTSSSQKVSNDEFQLEHENASPPQVDRKIISETIEALESLGYKGQDVSIAVQKKFQSGMNKSEEILKAILKEI